MSEILGYDIDGKPLRVGDRVSPVGTGGWHASAPPAPWTIARRSVSHPGCLMLEEVDLDGDVFSAVPGWLRRIDDRTDHKPAGQSFEQLVNGPKSGTPVTDPDLATA